MTDTAMRRQLFVEMTTAQQDAFLDGIRTRRLAGRAEYERVQAAKEAIRDERLREQATKELRMMEKELIALDKALAKVEARRTKLLIYSAVIQQESSNVLQGQ